MKSFKGFFALLTAAVFFFQAGPAQAYLGVKGSQTEEKITASGAGLAPLGVAGLLSFPGAGGAAMGGKFVWIIVGASAAVLVVVGILLILDEDGTGNVQFTALSERDGLDLGLTSEEVFAFNGNVDLVNAVMDELRMLDSETTDYDQAWTYFAEELQWSDTLKSAVSKMSFHAHHALTNY